MNDAHTSGRHQLNIGHLVMGLAFAGILGVWALVQGDVVTGDDVRWLLPVPWVLAGAVGLAVTAVTGARRHAVRQVGWVESELQPEHEPQDEHQPDHQPDHQPETDPEEKP